MAIAEILCYNEMTSPDKNRPGATKPLLPQCFYVQGNQVKFVCFEGGDRVRIDMFRNAGIFYTLWDASWHNRLARYTIRHIGDDPREWVTQTLNAYSSFCQNLLSTEPPPDPRDMEATVLVHAQELIHEVLQLHTGKIVNLEENTFPSMINRVHRLYGVTLNYEKICVPCTEDKPCLQINCSKCKIKDEALKVRRDAAQAFLEIGYHAPHTPEFVKDIWRRSVVRES